MEDHQKEGHQKEGHQKEGHQKEEKKYSVKSPRKHPKPSMGTPSTINQAVRQELWYVDTMVASPFRMVRRQLEGRQGAMAQSADEAMWAMEGMVRLPIKLIQAAFGEAPSVAPSDQHGESSH